PRAGGRRRVDRLGRPDHLQLLRGAARRPARRDGAHVEPGGRPPARSLLPPHVDSVRRVRIVLWHGYLLGGTGSNVYTRALAREWSKAGHEVVVFCQERRPELYDLAGAEVVRPGIGGLLPVFVLDRYEGLEARLLQDLTRGERERYVELNAAAVRDHLPADLVFANHVLPGAPVGASVGAPFVVKAHGSELEYSMRGNEELSEWGQETLAAAEGVVVGAEHHRNVLDDVVGHVQSGDEVPPGVDVELFRREPRAEALRNLLHESR